MVNIRSAATGQEVKSIVYAGLQEVGARSILLGQQGMRTWKRTPEKNARDKNIAKSQSVMVQRTMIFKHLVLASFLAVLAQTNPAWAQLPTAGGFAAVSDEWLLGTGQRWHHKTAPSNDPRTISELAPTQAEAALVIRAKKMLENGSARALLLANGRDVIWNGFAAPANPDSIFLSMSVGKTVTAMAVGQAICAGHLALDTKAETLLPELKGKDLGAATVHDLCA